MAAKKSNSKKSTSGKTIMDKIGEKASHLKDEIVSGKDHLVEVAGNAFESVKSSIERITHKKKAPKRATKKSSAKPKKTAVKRVTKKTPKKSAKKKAAAKR